MAKSDFQLQNIKREYKLTLCNPDKTKISKLKYSTINITFSFNDFNKLDFSVPFYEQGILKIKDKNFDLVKSPFLVLLQVKDNDTIKHQEYFKIITPKKDFNGSYTSNISCESTAFYVFNNKFLRSYKNKGSQKIYDTIGENGIINVLLSNLYNTWSVSYMNSKFDNIYHVFEFDKSSYIDVIKKVEQDCHCKIRFNTFNNTIQIYDLDEYGEQKDIILNDHNYIKSLSIEPDLSQLKNRIYVYGKNNTDISRYNPNGLHVENYDYFIGNGMSTSLANAWTTYKNKVNSLTPTFTSYVDQLDILTTSLNTKKNELNTLNTELDIIRINMNNQKNASYSNTTQYNTLRGQEQTKLNEINTKEEEILDINNQINTINTNITSIRNQLSYSSNFTTAQLQELIGFIQEDVKEIPTVSDPKLLYEYAKQYLDFKCQIPITFTVDSIDIFNIKDEQRTWDNFKEGNKIYIHCPELGYNYYSIRLMEINHNPIDNTLRLTFSNTNELNTIESRLEKILVKVDTLSDTVVVNKDDYASYSQEKDNLLTKDGVIDTAETEIKAGDFTINKYGFTGKDLETDGELEYLKDKIIAKRNNGAIYYNLLSSKGLHLETPNKAFRIYITEDYGFQIDKNVGTPENPVWSSVHYIGTNGDYIHEGTYKNIKDGQRIEIDSTGLSSKNSTDQLHGVALTNQGNDNGWDQLGWFLSNALKCYIAYQRNDDLGGAYFEIGTTGGEYIHITTDGYLRLWCNYIDIGENADSNIYIKGAVDCSDARFSELKNQSNQSYATENYVTSRGYITGTGINGSFTTVDGKTITINNGLVTSIV